MSAAARRHNGPALGKCEHSRSQAVVTVNVLISRLPSLFFFSFFFLLVHRQDEPPVVNVETIHEHRKCFGLPFRLHEENVIRSK